jgi:hypothetical protein
MDIMLELKSKLRDWPESAQNHRLIWAVATLLFHGMFRIRELVSEKDHEFDPAFTLLTDNIHVDESGPTIQVQLKAPKEDKKCRSKVVDVYSTGGPTCPVQAFLKWKAMLNDWPQQTPAFRWSNGKPLTAKRFNAVLKTCLQHLPSRTPTSHCFRIGAASRLGALGHSDEEVKAMGRWSSRAFEEYMLHPRTKRAFIAKQLAFNDEL